MSSLRMRQIPMIGRVGILALTVQVTCRVIAILLLVMTILTARTPVAILGDQNTHS